MSCINNRNTDSAVFTELVGVVSLDVRSVKIKIIKLSPQMVSMSEDLPVILIKHIY